MSFNVLHCKFTKYEDYGGAAKDEFGLFLTFPAKGTISTLKSGVSKF